MCSGALIAPNLVLTARHCVSGSPTRIDCATARFSGIEGAPTDYFVTTSPEINQSSRFYQVQKINVSAKNQVCGNDIALLILRNKVPSAEATPITPGVEYALTDHLHNSTNYTVIGYGATGPGSAGGAGTRRIRQDLSIACIPGDSALDCGPSAVGFVAPEEFMGGGGTCQGDSGSSAYEQVSFSAGSPVSLGVLSRGGEQDGECVAQIYTRTDSWKQLIIDAAMEAATIGGYAPPAWTRTTPPPPRDAGTPTKDSGTPPVPKEPGTAPAGDPCDKDSECASGLCREISGARACVDACQGDPLSCDEGFVCEDEEFCAPEKKVRGKDAGLAPDPAPPGAITTTTTTSGFGCAFTRPSDSSLVAPLSLLFLARRRRHGQRAR